jgi:hypothetical protein
LVSFAERERQSHADAAAIVAQFRHGIRVNRVAMNGVTSVTMAEWITRVADRDVLNHGGINAGNRVQPRL